MNEVETNVRKLLASGEAVKFMDLCDRMHNRHDTTAGEVFDCVGAMRDAGTMIVETSERNGMYKTCRIPAPEKKRPAYVAKIETERDEWKERAETAETKIRDLLAYLSLPKFQGEGNNFVNPADIFARLR